MVFTISFSFNFSLGPPRKALARPEDLRRGKHLSQNPMKVAEAGAKANTLDRESLAILLLASGPAATLPRPVTSQPAARHATTHSITKENEDDPFITPTSTLSHVTCSETRSLAHVSSIKRVPLNDDLEKLCGMRDPSMSDQESETGGSEVASTRSNCQDIESAKSSISERTASEEGNGSDGVDANDVDNMARNAVAVDDWREEHAGELSCGQEWEEIRSDGSVS